MTSLERVVLAGGGTTGHVAPLLATAEAIKARHPQVSVTAVGSVGGLEERVVPERGLPLELLPKVPFPRRPNAAAVKFPMTFASALKKAQAIIAQHDPQVVVGFGGHVSTPMYLAARRAGVPIVIHEQNARPGLANRLGSRFATHVATTFPGTALPGATSIGMPLRREIVELDLAARRDEAFEFFGLEAGHPTVLVTGGSLGAAALNEAFAARVDELRQAGIQVLHVTGRGKGFDVTPTTSGARYVVVEYLDRMDLAYAVADLVITRSGAGMVSELTTLGLPAVYVPLPIGNGEQKLNCRDVVAAGGGIMVENDDFTAEWIDANLMVLLTDPARLTAMRQAATSRSSANAAEALVELIEDAAATTTTKAK